MLKRCSMSILLPIVAACCMWGLPAICEEGLYNIGKAGLRDLPGAMVAIGWFGLNNFLRLATGEEGGFDSAGKSDLGGFVTGVGRAGGVVSVA
jgi:hypothetical protein